MAKPTRLTPVIKLRERTEQEALLNRSRSETAVQHQLQAQLLAKERVQTDGRSRGDAALWLLEETANAQARLALEAANVALQKAQAQLARAAAAHAQAHRATEQLRRIDLRWVEAAQQVAGRKESRELDELAIRRVIVRARAEAEVDAELEGQGEPERESEG